MDTQQGSKMTCKINVQGYRMVIYGRTLSRVCLMFFISCSGTEVRSLWIDPVT
jgi:hypothetical protein